MNKSSARETFKADIINRDISMLSNTSSRTSTRCSLIKIVRSCWTIFPFYLPPLSLTLFNVARARERQLAEKDEI